MIIVAITGASGVIYGVRLLKILDEIGEETTLLVTDPAEIILEHEMGITKNELDKLVNRNFNPKDLTTDINSGSCLFESMVIVPCTMKTAAAIANGYASNAITRAADVALKEKRNLIVVPRETPLRPVHLENLLKISREGGTILPAMPAFYHQPDKIENLVDFVVGKILDSLKIENHLFKRWQENQI